LTGFWARRCRDRSRAAASRWPDDINDHPGGGYGGQVRNHQGQAGKFRFHLKAPNGEIIAASQGAKSGWAASAVSFLTALAESNIFHTTALWDNLVFAGQAERLVADSREIC
jgi:hypothetical protein